MPDTKPWEYHWTHGAVWREAGKDSVGRLPTGQFVVCLRLSSGQERIHGPFASEADTNPCLASRCDCWKPSVKYDQEAAREVLRRRANGEMVP